MGESSFQDHRRENLGLLARVERRLLVWIAARMPPAVGSDHLTALGFAGMLVAAFSLWAVRWYEPAAMAAVAGLAVNWFGDSLDGTLARVRNQLRPRYGFYVDHILDCFGAVLLVAGLALSGMMSPTVAASFLAVYLLFNAEIFLATYTVGTFRMSYGWLGPTELRLLLAVGILRAAAHPRVSLFGQAHLLLDVGGIAGAVVLALGLGAASLRNTRRLFLAEPIRHP